MVEAIGEVFALGVVIWLNPLAAVDTCDQCARQAEGARLWSRAHLAALPHNIRLGAAPTPTYEEFVNRTNEHVRSPSAAASGRG